MICKPPFTKDVHNEGEVCLCCDLALNRIRDYYPLNTIPSKKPIGYSSQEWEKIKHDILENQKIFGSDFNFQIILYQCDD